MQVYAHLVQWTKDDPNSPGYAMTDTLVHTLATENADQSVPAEFFDSQIYFNYFSQQELIEQFTRTAPGLLAFIHYRDVSAMIFNSMENLEAYNTNKKLQPWWNSFEAARDAFLAKVQTHFTILDPLTVEAASSSKFDVQIAVGTWIDSYLGPVVPA